VRILYTPLGHVNSDEGQFTALNQWLKLSAHYLAARRSFTSLITSSATFFGQGM
jgi:hypothetical protein